VQAPILIFPGFLAGIWLFLKRVKPGSKNLNIFKTSVSKKEHFSKNIEKT